MALSIKDPKTERLARALAQRTGETLTVATRARSRSACVGSAGPRGAGRCSRIWRRSAAAGARCPCSTGAAPTRSSATTKTGCRADGNTSAVVAIALNEPDAETFEHRIADASMRLISAATVIETWLGDPGGSVLDLWVHKAGVEIVAVDAEQADHARGAWRRFGKGRYPAGLNFGDCFSYALSALTQEPLLFKGDDFSKTDIEAA